MAKKILDEYLVKLRGVKWNRIDQKEEPDKVVRILFWGDEIDIPNISENNDSSQQRVNVKFYNYGTGKIENGYIKKKKKKGIFVPLKFREENLLKVLFVDVQQGDATIITLPSGEHLLIDGGEGKFIARILAALFPKTTETKPVVFDSIIVTHGDADHFEGLFKIPDSETNSTKRKRIFFKTKHIYHNGLVKSGNSETKKAFGASKKVGKLLYATDLWDDPRDATLKSDTFKRWDGVIDKLLTSNGVIKRLKFGDDNEFSRHNKNGIQFKVLGPAFETINGKDALRYYKNERGSKTAGHTVNGHSAIIRLTYNHVNFFFGGDLNIDASEHLMEYYAHQNTEVNIKSEILKVPHHGSHEYYLDFLKTISPVVSVISSGDENVSKDYVHPRANLIGALGRASRNDSPLIFCTELAAFFAYMGYIKPPVKLIKNSGKKKTLNKGFPGFQRLVYGVVRVRTDGEKVLVAVESSSHIKEYYLLKIDALGNATYLKRPSII